jgi:hypothetical protein
MTKFPAKFWRKKPPDLEEKLNESPEQDIKDSISI